MRTSRTTRSRSRHGKFVGAEGAGLFSRSPLDANGFAIRLTLAFPIGTKAKICLLARTLDHRSDDHRGKKYKRQRNRQNLAAQDFAAQDFATPGRPSSHESLPAGLSY